MVILQVKMKIVGGTKMIDEDGDMILFCFNQQKMTKHRVKARKFKIKTLPEKWECIECGCLNG